MKQWNRGRRRVRIFAGLLAIVLTFVLAQGVAAQVIGIVEPVEWRDGRAHAFQAGRSLRIAGLASHPGGVANVLVNGQQARLQADPDFPDSYNFEYVLAPENVTGEVVIVIVPRTGERFEQRYRVNMPAAAPPTRTETPQRQIEPQIQQAGNPWGGFKVRGILYGVAAAGGLALTQLTKSETSEVCEQVQNGFDCFNRTETKPAYKGPGLALAGVAGVALVIDALLTSRKANSPVDGGDNGSENGAFRIELPNLQPSPDGARLELLRIRFRTP
jgi:hypothetical protein